MSSFSGGRQTFSLGGRTCCFRSSAFPWPAFCSSGAEKASRQPPRALCIVGLRPAHAGGQTMRPLRYLPRRTDAEKKQARKAAQRKWAIKNRETLLRHKREYARRPETLARRRELYRLHKEGAGSTGQQNCLLEPPAPRPLTLDDFVKNCPRRKRSGHGCQHGSVECPTAAALAGE